MISNATLSRRSRSCLRRSCSRFLLFYFHLQTKSRTAILSPAPSSGIMESLNAPPTQIAFRRAQSGGGSRGNQRRQQTAGGSLSFLAFDRPGSCIRRRAVFSSENFGGSSVFSLALLPGASLRGIAPDLLRPGGSRSQARRLGGTRYVDPSYFSYFLFY